MAVDGAASSSGARRRRRPRRLGAPRPEGCTPYQTAPYGWAPIAIMVAVGIVDGIETRITAGVLPLLQAEFGIGDTAAGAIPAAVVIAGAFALLPAGWLADRYNRSNLIALVVLSWAVLLVGTALAVSFAMFFAMRVLLGAADSIDNPASGSLLADSYPPLARARVFGYARLTGMLGAGIGTALGAAVGDALGWRWAYGMMIVPGLICAWLCWRLREPARGFIDVLAARDDPKPVPAPPSPDDDPVSPLAKVAEVVSGLRRGPGRGRPGAREAPTEGGRRTAGPRMPRADLAEFRAQVREVLRIPTLRTVTVGLAAMTFCLGGLIFWVPTLVVREFGLSVGEAGVAAGGASMVGLVGGALYGGRLGRLWHGVRRGGRLLAGGGGLLIGSALFLVALAQPTVGRLLVGIAVSTFFSSLSIPNLSSAIADVVMAHVRGIGFSLLQFVIAVAGAWGPLVVGIVSDRSGSLTTAMYVLGVPGVLSALPVLAARGTYDADARYVLEEALRREEDDGRS